MSTYQTKPILPMSQRLTLPRSQGGPTNKHLINILKLLDVNNQVDHSSYNPNDQFSIAAKIKSLYSANQIDYANEELKRMYNRENENRGRQYNPPVKVPTDNRKDGEKPINQGSDGKQAEQNKSSSSSNVNAEDEYVTRKEFNKHQEDEVNIFVEHEIKINENANKLKKIETDLNNDNVTQRHISNDIFNRLNKLELNKPVTLEIKTLEIKTLEAPTYNVGIVHKQFPLLVQAANARLPDKTRLNIWLYGPAGTGKTHAAKKLAEVYFGSDNYRETNSQTREEFTEQWKHDWSDYNYSPTLSTGFEVMGYNDAHGRYVPTPFYLTWKYGGVFLLDEIDGSMQDALLKLNGALSSTYASFPCGMVERHPDTIIIAGANTTGYGGDIEYLGTMKQNLAFLDRWSFISWPHDDALENSLVNNPRWVQRVREVRAKLTSQKIKGHVITMRASIYGAALIEAGLSFDQVEQMVLRKGIPQGIWEQIK